MKLVGVIYGLKSSPAIFEVNNFLEFEIFSLISGIFSDNPFFTDPPRFGNFGSNEQYSFGQETISRVCRQYKSWVSFQEKENHNSQ